MKLQSKFLLAFLTVISVNFVTFADDREDDREYESRRRKVCKCCSLIVTGNGSFGGTLTVSGSETVGGNLSVTGNEAVGGNVTVTGSITGGSFAVSPAAAVGTPGLPGVGGALAWGEVGNGASVTVGTGAFFPMSYANVAPAFSGIVESATGTAATDGLTLTFAGIYLIFYQATDVNTTGAAVVSQIQLTSTGATIPNSTVTMTTPATTGVNQLTGFIITSQPAGAFIQLRNSGAGNFVTPVAGAGAPNNNIGAKLTAIRIA